MSTNPLARIDTRFFCVTALPRCALARLAALARRVFEGLTPEGTPSAAS